eukprot:2634968-Rhodomonas_salina.1
MTFMKSRARRRKREREETGRTWAAASSMRFWRVGGGEEGGQTMLSSGRTASRVSELWSHGIA